MELNVNEFEIKKTISKLNFRDLIIFLMPILIFLYYLHVYDPGILTVDSFNQLHQIATGHFTNWHPFFHTFIEIICISIYPSPSSVGVLQIFTFSIIWVIICKYFRDDDNSNSKKTFLIQAIITLAICLIPINAIYSITLWKDILFSYGMLFLCFLIKVMVDRNWNVNIPFVVILALTMACIAQIRSNGIYLIIITLIIVAFYFYKNNKQDKIHILLPALTIIFILLIGSLNIIYDVEDTDVDAVYGKVSHMLADYDLNLDLNDEDRNKIHEMVPEELSREKYDLHFIDPIRDNANAEAYENDKGTYISLAIKYSLMNPIHCIQYLLGSSAMVWDIVRNDDWVGNVYKTDINNANRFFYAHTNNETAVAGYDGVMATNSKTDEYLNLNGFAYYIKENKALDTIFESPALYMYLSIILMIAIQLLTKTKSIYLIYLPNLLNIGIIFLSTPIQDTRYLYPNILIFYLLLIIFVGIIIKNNDDEKNIKYSNTPNSKNILNKKFIENNNIKTHSQNIIKPKHNINPEETPKEMEARIRAKILEELLKDK